MGASLHDWNCLKVDASTLRAIKDENPMKRILLILYETQEKDEVRQHLKQIQYLQENISMPGDFIQGLTLLSGNE